MPNYVSCSGGAVSVTYIKISCINCGRILADSGDGTNTRMCCPKCGAELEYQVTNNAASIRLIKYSGKASNGRKTAQTA